MGYCFAQFAQFTIEAMFVDANQTDVLWLLVME